MRGIFGKEENNFSNLSGSRLAFQEYSGDDSEVQQARSCMPSPWATREWMTMTIALGCPYIAELVDL